LCEPADVEGSYCQASYQLSARSFFGDIMFLQNVRLPLHYRNTVIAVKTSNSANNIVYCHSLCAQELKEVKG
jgi:hypothetical protein